MCPFFCRILQWTIAPAKLTSISSNIRKCNPVNRSRSAGPSHDNRGFFCGGGIEWGPGAKHTADVGSGYDIAPAAQEVLQRLGVSQEGWCAPPGPPFTSSMGGQRWFLFPWRAAFCGQQEDAGRKPLVNPIPPVGEWLFF